MCVLCQAFTLEMSKFVKKLSEFNAQLPRVPKRHMEKKITEKVKLARPPVVLCERDRQTDRQTDRQ